MTHSAISTPDAPKPAGAYSQGIRAGDFVYVAGQGGHDPATGSLPETVEGQTEQALRNVAAILAAAGVDLADVVKSTVHLADLEDFAVYDDTYRRVMPEPWPVRTTVRSGLVGIAVEIDVVAYAPVAGSLR